MNPSPAAAPRRRRARIPLFLAAVLAVMLGMLEGAFRLLDPMAADRAALARPEGDDPANTGEAGANARAGALFLAHPYRGWAGVPGRRADYVFSQKASIFPDGRPTRWARANARYNLFGAASSIEDYRDLDPGDFQVAIFGGSVAEQLAVVGGEVLRDGLARELGLPPGRVHVVDMGSNEGKQPQQLQGLAELRLLGVDVDLVVNLDGFNEVHFGARDARKGHHPYLPAHARLRSILDLASASPSPERLAAAAEILRHRRAIARLRDRGNGGLVGVSRFLQSLIGRQVRGHERAVLEANRSLDEGSEAGGEGDVPLVAFPDPCPGEAEGCPELIADLWMRSSVLMRDVARGAGADYLHVLQPNQYVPGSKPLSDEERASAYLADTDRARAVRAGYPALQARAPALREAGVVFVDATKLFADVEVTIYRDVCCHLNLEGNRRLAEAIVEAFGESRHPASPPP